MCNRAQAGDYIRGYPNGTYDEPAPNFPQGGQGEAVTRSSAPHLAGQPAPGSQPARLADLERRIALLERDKDNGAR